MIKTLVSLGHRRLCDCQNMYSSYATVYQRRCSPMHTGPLLSVQ